MSYVRCVGLLLVLMLAGVVAAEERPALDLLRPDSLIGWEHGEPPQGWTIDDGVLSGGKDASRLISGWTLGDFELSFAWKADDQGAAKLLLTSDKPEGAVELTLKADAAPQLSFTSPGAKTVTRAGDVGAREQFQQATLRRDGATLELTVRGEINHSKVQFVVSSKVQVGIPADARFLLAIAIEGGRVELKDLQLREPAGEPIFNGKDLSGWWTTGNKNAWHAENGELVKRGSGGKYLQTEQEFGNFTLSLDYLMEDSDNSGIAIRTARDGWPSTEGMELQLQNSPGMDKHALMAVYGNLPPVARADKSRQWNHTIVKADGPMISVWVNGELVQHANTAAHPELKHRRAAGWIGFQDHGGVVRFRNIRVLEAPDGQGPAVWRKFKPSAAELIANRLMNPEQVAVQDGLRSQTLTPQVGDADEQVLAELQGPGALVRIAPSNPQGRLAFYFDGEQQPRLECPVKDLPSRLPRLNEDQLPVLTCLPYEKSLKIVLLDGQPGQYWIDTVHKPNNLPIESYAGGEVLPRGWISALEYRRHHQRYGVLRTHGPYETTGESNQQLEPGDAAELVAIDGAGLVEWLKLDCPADVLQNDDLWLEVRYDQQQKPALAAPARYFFAPICDRKKHVNYLFSVSGPGFASRFALPFGKGLTITARNQGGQPIEKLGLTASYRTAGEEQPRREYDQMLRLHGKFEQGDTVGAVRLDGAGRLVGLVQEHADAAATEQAKIASLSIDGEPQSAWNDVSYERFLGAAQEVEVFRHALSGRVGPLTWRYLQLAPLEFDQSLTLQFDGPAPRSRLLLYYAE